MGQENQTNTLQELTKRLAEEAEKRTKQLMRRKVPEKRTLANALMTMTRQELDDIAHNVGLSGTSSLKKAELVEQLVPATISFAGEWFVSMVDEQYQAFRHIVNKEGISTEFRADEDRLDYFEYNGLLASGSFEGKLAWYMPIEIMEEFKRLDSGSFSKAVEFNSDVMRVASGLLFYYGAMGYEELFKKTRKYLDQDDTFEYIDFMRVMMNGATWQRNLVAQENFISYYTVLDPAKLIEQREGGDYGFAKLSYTQVYEAGEENYIEASKDYQALGQFLMRQYKFEVLKAAGIVGQITFILQNGGSLVEDVFGYLKTQGVSTEDDSAHELVVLLIAFHKSLRLWALKGHTITEVESGKFDPPLIDNVVSLADRRKKKVGRNDLCPCGSGKKYKKCCMQKGSDEE